MDLSFTRYSDKPYNIIYNIFNKENTMTKWIETDQAFLMMIKYDKETVEEYQLYLDNDIWSLIDRYDDEEIMDFDEWYECFLEEIEFFNSDEYKQEMERLAEKD